MTDLDRLVFPVADGTVALPAGPMLFLNARPGPGLSELGPERLQCEQGFRPEHDALAGIAVAPRVEGGDFASAAVLVTRNRAETLGLVARALGALPEGGLLLVSGAKTDGIDSILSRVKAVVPVQGGLSKGHGRTFWLTRPAELPEAVSGWAAEAAPRRNAGDFLTAPGMFSHDHADPGSALLVEALAGVKKGLKGRVADLGSGYGWLSAAVLAAHPDIRSLALYEADHAALEAARVNVADPRASFHWADATGLGKRDGPFDVVITNPPFHTGRAAEPALGQAFIAAAARVLTPGGRLYLVANRQLPYEAALEQAFIERDTLATTGGFKVLTAFRPKKK
ncbi:class I SAM-dependent methyltransferase [Paroceanicella profunda]|uniref:Class I SAM-dependent methyltransferase n=1 Tax=Paroceanicella profunda TaxID=2579971 RepID=A0A5B8FGH7_9RHOB|nr:class I SAM-dependent methyltransferase [Paroceanicella profunda]QDL91241.1 class I SAM-dependent methyltransferase [Paroceanicella profunda]